MRGLPTVSASGVRARRWDAVVLGSALPGLVAAVRLGMHGARVLVLEEEAATRDFAGLREPFHTTGAGGGSVFGACLQALGVALIDRRRIEAQPLAYQVALPEARVDVGESSRTGTELVAWGLAKPETARDLLRALAEGSAAERDAMLAASVVPPGRRLPRTAMRPAPGAPLPAPAAPRRARGLPAEVKAASGTLQAFLDAQLRALSNLGGAPPSPEAASRLLGVALEGGATVTSVETGLRTLLRRRVEALFGEFRSLEGVFRLVQASRQPGVATADGAELLLGRALVVNAPHAALADFLEQEPAPGFLAAPAAGYRRVAVHLLAPREVVPEGMAPRVVRVRDLALPLEGTNVVTIRCWPPSRKGDPVHIVASAVVPAGDPDLASREAEIERSVSGLMPFASERLRRGPRAEARWDQDAWIADPPPGSAWPSEVDMRVSSRPPVFSLERSPVAGLGVEGELLLGWRAGDAIAAELA